MMEPGYKEYLVKGEIVQAKKSPGGRFYFTILPDGQRFTMLAVVFEKMAVPVKNARGHCMR
jgi:hypothetical protein